MALKWTKNLLPKGLYGRAALILIAPILILQIVVSVVFLQRHYDRVTEQMTRSLNLEINYLIGAINSETEIEQAKVVAQSIGDPLGLKVSLPANREIGNRMRFYDLSGRAMLRELQRSGPTVTALDVVTNWREVHLLLKTDHGPVLLEFARGRVSASNPHQLLVLMLVIGILMTVIAYLFLRNQLRPIRRLAMAAANFGRGEATNYKPQGAIEVRQAGQAFLEMRARIERQIEQRTQMLSGVSHDLRTPLTRMRLGISMLEETEETEALLKDVSDMEALVDSFLDFARGEATEDHQDVNPVALARSVVENAKRSGAGVEFLAMDGGDLVALRPMAIRRALSNLIGNALRYGKNARVSVDIYDKGIRFRVEDDGPGISADHREAALRPFTRLDPGRNQNKGSGVGLGLSIAADIARGHGGSLRLSDSAALGGLQADLVIAR